MRASLEAQSPDTSQLLPAWALVYKRLTMDNSRCVVHQMTALHATLACCSSRSPGRLQHIHRLRTLH